ncbi:hypothetical protein [Flavobacterium sp. HSC-61S13]|uniref:hypothetical protein n=1 Tax=Flavobacterium sp. HSC-61S13 TaxID=2910963 RepID=UPI0020A124A1|nr:hypothetical protein [Flavobacterium sp. HSC-61S13]MCP1996622.1 hypothetical protein [Flavobacterium sp. HSC-61S13]
MQKKTISKVITKKLNEWLETITDESLRKKVKENLLVSGGSITSMFLNEPVNDFDIYIQDMDVLIELAMYYMPNDVLDGRKKDELILDHYIKKYGNLNCAKKELESLNEDLSEQTVRLKNLKPNQVKLNVESSGQRMQIDENKKYQIAFLSQNAISLTDDIQIVLRFSGAPEEIHSTFDFIHATNYFTFEDGVVTNLQALESLISKDLKYQGSQYPLTSIIRIKKFLKRGWTINAGEMLKMMFQISELNLKDPVVLEEQLIGVDIAYFDKLIDVIRDVPRDKINSNYINTIIDKVFSQYEEIEETPKAASNSND